MPFGRSVNTAIGVSNRIAAAGGIYDTANPNGTYKKDTYIDEVMREYGILKQQMKEQAEATALDGGQGKFSTALDNHYKAVKKNIGMTWDIFNNHFAALIAAGHPYEKAVDEAFDVVDEAIKGAQRRAEIQQPKTLVTNKMKSSVVNVV